MMLIQDEKTLCFSLTPLPLVFALLLGCVSLFRSGRQLAFCLNCAEAPRVFADAVNWLTVFSNSQDWGILAL
jgi:hypothetical protein